MRIRTKLTLSIALIFGVTLGALAALLFRQEARKVRAGNAERIGILEAVLRRAADEALRRKDEALLLSHARSLRAGFRALIYCRVAWVDGAGTREHLVGQWPAAGEIEERRLEVRGPDARRVELTLGLNRHLLEARVEQDLGRLRGELLRLFLVALLVGVAFSDWFARRLAEPLGALVKAAARIGEGRQGVRLDRESQDEIGELVRGFNQMSERLEDLDALKRDFVSSVTHELRSPLGAIESFLNLIESQGASGKADPARAQEYLARIKANVRRLSGFISDLLDVAKLERGKMECSLRPMRIQDVAEDVVQFFEAKAKEQGVAVASRIPPDFAQVQGDPDRLRQVLVNLVANALKFTPRGGQVWIQAEQYREEGGGFGEISVFDTGRGMDFEDMERLFAKFSQGRNVQGGVAGPKGTGLGLYIVKSIIEAHGGKVSVKSSRGKGTRFFFNLKLA